MNKYITPALLAIILTLAVALVPAVAGAQSNDIGSGGSSSIIGLPSGRSYFQDASSQAQSGVFNNPAGGSDLLKENKSALLIVDSPPSSTPSSEPEVSSSNIWWVVILGVIALFSLIGAAIFLVPQRMWQTESDEETPEEPEEPEEPETPVAETNTAQAIAIAEETLREVEVEDNLNKVQVIEIETEKEAEQANKKSTKKRKHGGRPTKKSRK